MRRQQLATHLVAGPDAGCLSRGVRCQEGQGTHALVLQPHCGHPVLDAKVAGALAAAQRQFQETAPAIQLVGAALKVQSQRPQRCRTGANPLRLVCQEHGQDEPASGCACCKLLRPRHVAKQRALRRHLFAKQACASMATPRQ
jgi:hypothetical protein